jgi:hypothetical protein
MTRIGSKAPFLLSAELFGFRPPSSRVRSTYFKGRERSGNAITAMKEKRGVLKAELAMGRLATL